MIRVPRFDVPHVPGAYIAILKEAVERGAGSVGKRLGLTHIHEDKWTSILAESKDAGGMHLQFHKHTGTVAIHRVRQEHLAKLQALEEFAALEPMRVVRSCVSPQQQELLQAMTAFMRAFENVGGASAAIPIPAKAQRGVTLGTDPSWSWCLELVGMPAGYSKATGKGVKVAVLDTGIDVDHPDFADRLEPARMRNFVSSLAEASVDDGNGHGTHCAGVVGARADSSGAKRYAVAPGSTLLIGKVLDDAGRGTDESILAGINWAVEQGARIISLSLGSARGLNQPYSEVYQQLARRIAPETGPGTLIVAAAGNDSNRSVDPPLYAPVGNPGACPAILSVAACDQSKAVGSFSNAEVDRIGRLGVASPGVQVYSAWNNGSFRSIDGTSMATPHVSGIGALLLELAPDLSVDALRARIVEMAEEIGPRRDFGHGLAKVP